jgi:hypothetical protein
VISKRPLAALIWVAIVTIAVQLLPTVAFAHAGHSHARDLISTGDRGNADDATPLNAKDIEHGVAEIAVAGVDAAGSAVPSATCNGGCCSSGFSCCAPAMLSEPVARLPVPLSGLTLVRSAAPMRPGVDPETLPKPPKSFN